MSLGTVAAAQQQTGTGRAFERFNLMAFMFSTPSRAAPDPPGMILSAAEAARRAMLRAALLPPQPRPNR